MNLRDAKSSLHRFLFRAARVVSGLLSGGRISAFGPRDDQIGLILVVNLDRQPTRWRQVTRELGRFRTSDGASLMSIVQRMPAVDARDGRAVAATADVDPVYRLGDQLYVQPDARLAGSFDIDEPVRMTLQEIAVARSHVEVWKAVATGLHGYVLILEDDIWFTCGAATTIGSAWRAALQRCRSIGGPRLLYLSYEDAGGTALRLDPCDTLFRPARGLWFLSGYVLSREGASTLLRAMPVVGPVDMWMNYRFTELGALALSTPVILQRPDSSSDNSYSVLPFLARAGIVDVRTAPLQRERPCTRSVLVWTAHSEPESLAMALSMLGLRVRVFDGNEAAIGAQEIARLLETFDVLIDPLLAAPAVLAATARTDVLFILDENAVLPPGVQRAVLPSLRTMTMPVAASWIPLCTFLGLPPPAESFPVGVARSLRVFRDDREQVATRPAVAAPAVGPMDDSPWVLPPGSNWRAREPGRERVLRVGACQIRAALSMPSPLLRCLVETFPGNRASFSTEGLVHDDEGLRLVASKVATRGRPYRSGAFASSSTFEYGRFEVDIKSAPGSGLITGFFLHRDAPRQEIDIELAGNDPRRLLVNVYFNPGDDGAALGYGYRGSPCRIDLGFDATEDFHRYAIDWRPGLIAWLVDDRIVHERVGWDPTPLPHLPMRLHANLWVPRSEVLAGRLDERVLPATATLRNLSVWT